MAVNISGFELYMWISFYVFLLPFIIILTAKLIQYFRRWGESKSQNLEYTSDILHISIGTKTLALNSKTIKPKSSQNLKKVLLFTPFTVSLKRYLYLATAIALNNFEVVLIESRANILKIKKNKIDGQNFATELIKVISPNTIIASDVIFPLFIPEMQRNTGIRFVYLRPIISFIEKSLLSSFLLTIPGISSIYRLIMNPLIYQDRGIFSSFSNKILCIYPTSFLRKHSRTVSQNNLTIHVLRSRFSFRNKETLVFALIMRFIGEVSS